MVIVFESALNVLSVYNSSFSKQAVITLYNESALYFICGINSTLLFSTSVPTAKLDA